MLEELSVRNLGPIRDAQIAPAPGFTAITGETGAGKSMLLSAIRLISGGAASGSRSVGARRVLRARRLRYLRRLRHCERRRDA